MIDLFLKHLVDLEDTYKNDRYETIFTHMSKQNTCKEIVLYF